jgi:hypothetical protein
MVKELFPLTAVACAAASLVTGALWLVGESFGQTWLQLALVVAFFVSMQVTVLTLIVVLRLSAAIGAMNQRFAALAEKLSHAPFMKRRRSEK